MKTANPTARPASQARTALAAQLAHVAGLQSRIDAQPAKRTEGERKSAAADATEQTRLQHLLSEAVAKREELVGDVLIEDELPRRIRAYQARVLQVNAAWNDILALDGVMRRHYPGRRSIFNTAGPHERAVLAPSTDRSPLPPLTIDSHKLFATASRETDRFVEALARDAAARFGDS
jgi:hypothetical protein